METSRRRFSPAYLPFFSLVTTIPVPYIYKAEVCFLFGLRQNEKFTLTSQVLGCTSKSEYIFGDKIKNTKKSRFLY